MDSLHTWTRLIPTTFKTMTIKARTALFTYLPLLQIKPSELKKPGRLDADEVLLGLTILPLPSSPLLPARNLIGLPVLKLPARNLLGLPDLS